MKLFQFIILIIFLLVPVKFRAQTKLPDSSKRSANWYIYTISKDNLRKIHLKGEDVTEDMLGEYVADFPQGKHWPKFPRGNYIGVYAVEDKLNFTDDTVDDLYFKVVPAEEFMLCLYDSLGNFIPDAIVKCGNKTLKFDKSTRTYNAKSIKAGQTLEINNKGVYHYLEIEKSDSYYRAYKKNVFKSFWWSVKKLWYNIKQGVKNIFYPNEWQPTQNKYTGFIVFSKPKYKPGERVKFKAYMADLKGKPYNKQVSLSLSNYYPLRMDTVLTVLTPYRPGMYEYEFDLTDKLNMTLDAAYTMEIETENERHNTIRGSFIYEDYELKGIRFAMKTDKEEYAKGDSVKLKFTITDENELAVYDGKIEVTVKAEPVNYSHVKKLSSGFVPDTLWTHTLMLDGGLDREIVLPDSIFPPGIPLDYRVQATYLSSDSEKQTAQKLLSRKADDYTLDFSLKKGMLTITELLEGKTQPGMADILVEGKDGEIILSKSVMLPHTMPLPWYASDITVKTSHTTDFFFTDDIKEEQIGYRFFRQNDSVFLIVDNPADIPFWYTIRRNKKEISQGYTTQLDYSVKDNDQGYNMQLSYILGEKGRVLEQELPFAQKNISMDISTPTTVYPGQQADVKITVTDKKGKPVNNVDITAYSFTSKFKDYNMPWIAVRGKAKHARYFKRANYESDESFIAKQNKMTWNRWKGTMNLDTIVYYKFLYPDTFYVYTEPTADGSTVVSPYVVIDGALQKVHMLSIDERLYYTSVAEQREGYVFQVEPGKHTFKFRTHDREVSVHNVYVKKGERNIFSFNVEQPYIKAKTMHKDIDLPLVISSRLLDKKKRTFPNDMEKAYLSDQLITMDNNFGTIQLPYQSNTMDVPAYIKSGSRYYFINHTNKRHYNSALRGYVNTPVLAGPFPQRSIVNGIADIATVYREDKEQIGMIELDGGSKYTLYPGYQKIKSWNELPFKQSTVSRGSAGNFREMPLTVDSIMKYSKDRLLSILREARGPAVVKKMPETREELPARLDVYLGKDLQGKKLAPALIFILPEEKKEIGKYQLYYGGTNYFTALPSGKSKLSLVFNDTLSYTRDITLYEGGRNFVHIDSISYDTGRETAEAVFRMFNRGVTKTYPGNPYLTTDVKDSIVTIAVQDIDSYQDGYIRQGTVSGILTDNVGDPLIGATVRVIGTTIGTFTDLDGYFELSGVTYGDKIEFSYIGYTSNSIKYAGETNLEIKMEEDKQLLSEVVVVGYGVQKRADLTGSISETAYMSEVMAGKAPGIMIRGTSSSDNGEPPLVLVNGLPYAGSIDDLDQASILSFNILKDASATAIYGSRAANGVIMIQTNATGINIPGAQADTETPVMEAGNSMRRNFHDDAFWQPRLKTNDRGEASFNVTYPDDITSWNAYFIAIGNKKQSDKRQMTIHSFKALVAGLSTPRFAVRGDSLNTVGKITNHMGDTLSVKRKIELDRQIQEEDLRLTTSHVDYIPVTAQQGDSVTIAYSMQLANGYFDGEERSFPIIEQGMQQTYGEFRVLNDTTTFAFVPEPGLGAVTVNAEASSLELFLQEIEKVDSYPYMCNEQMASKIKVLLSKKRIAEMFNLEFKEDKKINNLISRLNRNKNKDGKWGWWNKGNTENWITNQVIYAFLEAEEAGFKTGLDITKWGERLIGELKTGISSLKLTPHDKIPYAKQGLLDHLIHLKRIDAQIEYAQYFEQIDKQLPSITVADKLKTMEALAAIGMQDKINMDSLMYYSHQTMLGSTFWGENKDEHSLYRGFILPYNTNTTQTLIAYKILRAVGGYEKEMENVRNYFFERRRGGSWTNTYESSRIIETIMPDMLCAEQPLTEVSMTMNGRKITEFPFTEKTEAIVPLNIRKNGTMPVFLAVYQQAWNPDPKPEALKGFAVKTVFKTNGDTISTLTSGKTTQLEVIVNVDAQAEYVQIEVPIPAGCSYDSKRAGYYWKEAHREHFKGKVVIFCNKLTEGEHRFTIDLIPRFTGKYSLNPAKVELMYFPVFYGNEEMKQVIIE